MRMHTRRVRLSFLLSLCLATSALAVEITSPLEEASALQRQLHSVVDRSCNSVYAVTAFGANVSDPRLFRKSVAASTFMEVAETAQRSCGSAFAIDADGFLLTNEHVVSGASSVWVTDDAGQTLPALVVGTDPRSDLAVLRVPAKVKPIEFAEQPLAERGDLVATIGNPGGISITGKMAASVGCISATGRALPTLSAREHRFYGDLLQITTPITTGSSGGPLLDLSGNAIGIVCAVVPNSSTEQNIGFAISLSAGTRSRIEQLKHGDESIYGYLGVNVSPAEVQIVSTTFADPVNRQPEGETRAVSSGTVSRNAPLGARVDRIDPGTPAAGVLQIGDVIKTFDGQEIHSDIDFIRLAGACAVDRDVTMSVARDGNATELTVRPRRRELPVQPVTTVTQRFCWAGVTFANHAQGAIVTGVEASAETPLKVGSILTRIDGKPVTNLSQLLDLFHTHAGEPLEIKLAPDASDGR